MDNYGKGVEGEETSSRGVDWEVVSLTASAYAAAPETEGSSLISGIKDRSWEENKSEYAREMFMSGHFVFPPSAHENLPLESVYADILTQSKFEEPGAIQGEDTSTGEELSKNVKRENLSISDTLSEEKEEILTLLESKLEKDDEGGSIQMGDEEDSSKEDSSSSKSSNLSNSGKSKIPCESWWTRRAISIYVHAKEAGAVWSLCAAAALMGLVILGHRWHQERLKIQYVSSRFSVGEEV